jgi:hypothetical protein
MIKKTLARWWLITVITVCGFVPVYQYGIFHDIYKADVTGIHLVIYGVFLIATILTGIAAYRTSKDSSKEYSATTHKVIEMNWFCSEAMMTLGLIGTVAGMIYLFGQIFIEIDPSDPEDLKKALSYMATGLSTAMYTTICGMIGALLIKVQLMSIEFDQDE